MLRELLADGLQELLPVGLLLRRRLCQFLLLASPPRRGRGGSRGARSGSRSGARSVLAGEVEQGPEAAGVQVAADPRRLVGGEGPGQVGPGLGLRPLPLLLRRVGASRLGGLVSCLGIGRRALSNQRRFALSTQHHRDFGHDHLRQYATAVQHRPREAEQAAGVAGGVRAQAGCDDRGRVAASHERRTAARALRRFLCQRQ